MKIIRADSLGSDECLGTEYEAIGKYGNLVFRSMKYNVITIATQYDNGKNVTLDDLVDQVSYIISGYNDIKISFVVESSLNEDIISSIYCIKGLFETNIYPVVNTIMPRRNKNLDWFIIDWMTVKNELCNGNAGLNIILNSTLESERNTIFKGKAYSLRDISSLMSDIRIKGRKIALDFLVPDTEVDFDKLAYYFDPMNFIVRLVFGDSFKPSIEVESMETAGFEVLIVRKYGHENQKSLGWVLKCK